MAKKPDTPPATTQPADKPDTPEDTVPGLVAPNPLQAEVEHLRAVNLQLEADLVTKLEVANNLQQQVNDLTTALDSALHNADQELATFRRELAAASRQPVDGPEARTIETRRPWSVGGNALPVGTTVARVQLAPGLDFNLFVAAAHRGFLREQTT